MMNKKDNKVTVFLGAVEVEFEVRENEKGFEYYEMPWEKYMSVNNDGGVDDWGNYILEQ